MKTLIAILLGAMVVSAQVPVPQLQGVIQPTKIQTVTTNWITLRRDIARKPSWIQTADIKYDIVHQYGMRRTVEELVFAFEGQEVRHKLSERDDFIDPMPYRKRMVMEGMSDDWEGGGLWIGSHFTNSPTQFAIGVTNIIDPNWVTITNLHVFDVVSFTNRLEIMQREALQAIADLRRNFNESIK